MRGSSVCIPMTGNACCWESRYFSSLVREPRMQPDERIVNESRRHPWVVPQAWVRRPFVSLAGNALFRHGFPGHPDLVWAEAVSLFGLRSSCFRWLAEQDRSADSAEL